MHTRNEEGHLMVDIGKDLLVPVDESRFTNPDAIDHRNYIGYKNLLQDAHASVTAKSFPELGGEELVAAIKNDSLALALKKLDALYAGDLRVSNGRASSVDPIAKEMRRIAIDTFIRRNGRKLKPSNEDLDIIMENPEVAKWARENVKRAAAIAQS